MKVIIIIFISTRDATLTYCALLTLTRPNIILSCTYLIAALASHSQRSLLLLLLLFSSICCAYDFNHYPRPSGSAYPVPRSRSPFHFATLFLFFCASKCSDFVPFLFSFFLSFIISFFHTLPFAWAQLIIVTDAVNPIGNTFYSSVVILNLLLPFLFPLPSPPCPLSAYRSTLLFAGIVLRRWQCKVTCRENWLQFNPLRKVCLCLQPFILSLSLFLTVSLVLSHKKGIPKWMLINLMRHSRESQSVQMATNKQDT